MQPVRNPRGGMRIIRAAAVLVLILLVCAATAGCFGVRTPLVSRDSAPEVIIDYHRSGGPSGLDDRLVIFNNGAAIVSTRTGSKEMVLNTTDVVRISDLFNQTGFSLLQDNYPAHHAGDNLVQYSLTFQNKTVTTEENGYPELLKPVIEELDRFVTMSGT